MVVSPEELARRLGATIRGEIPDWGGGALAALQQGKVFALRMEELRREETAFNPNGSLEVSLSPPVQDALRLLADIFNAHQEKIAELLLARSAAHLLEQWVKESQHLSQTSKKSLEQAESESQRLRALVDEILTNFPRSTESTH